MREDDGAGAGRAGGEVGPYPVHGRAEDRRVIGLRGGQCVADQRGFEVGQAVAGDVAVLVAEHDGVGAARRVGAQMDSGALDQPGADAEAARRIVVAGDHHGGDAQPGEAVQGLVEEFDGRERRHRPVVHVARDEHGVDVLFAYGLDEAVDEPALGVQHAHPVERTSQMPVGRVQNSQETAPTCMFSPSPPL